MSNPSDEGGNLWNQSPFIGFRMTSHQGVGVQFDWTAEFGRPTVSIGAHFEPNFRQITEPARGSSHSSFWCMLTGAVKWLG